MDSQLVDGDDDETEARAINAEPWEPLPGMIKLRCQECRFCFAARRRTALCPDCAAFGTRAGRGR
jgi:hypothetical protein